MYARRLQDVEPDMLPRDHDVGIFSVSCRQHGNYPAILPLLDQDVPIANITCFPSFSLLLKNFEICLQFRWEASTITANSSNKVRATV